MCDPPLCQVDAKFKETVHKISLDISKWSSYLGASRTDDAKRHQNSVFHAEAQKAVGQVVVDRYMDKNTKFFCNKDPEQVTQVFQMFKKSVMSDARLEKQNVYNVVLIDFTKHGSISQDLIDWTIGMASKVADDCNSVVVVIAPVLESSNVEHGEAGERARIEKKLRARDLSPVLITLMSLGPWCDM